MSQDIRQLEAALDKDPRDADALDQLEGAYIDAGKLDDLVDWFESWTGRIEDPDAAEDAWLALAGRLERTSGLAADKGDKRKAGELLYAAGELYNLRLGRKDKAMLCYQKAFKADPGMSHALGAARTIYMEQESWPMVVRLYELQLQVTRDADRRVELLYEMGRVLGEELKKPDDAAMAYREALELRPESKEIEEALKYVTSVQESWREIVDRYEAEAEAASNDALSASLYLRVAEILLKEDADSDRIDDALKQCLSRDPQNPKAFALLSDRVGADGDPVEYRRILEGQLHSAGSREEKLEALVGLARLATSTGNSEEAAARYKEALAIEPGRVEALHYLRDILGEQDDWDEVVGLYDRALKLLRRGPDEVRLLVELAEIHRSKLDDLDTAERYYRRIKLNDPRNPDMLGFYQDFYRVREDWRKLLTTLASLQQQEEETDARVLLGYEMAEIAEEKLDNLDKAIDVWKGVSRIAPKNPEARTSLKRLFQKTQKWNALLEFLKEEISALGPDELEGKVALYEEMVRIYRDQLHLDVMVINTYNAILQVDPSNAQALDALASRYEKANRWNDLIGVLQKKADRTEDPAELVPLLHRIASLWLERFSNQGKAIPALERILEVRPDHREAIDELQRLFQARRDWRRLLEVYERELDLLAPEESADRLEEMAGIAQDRLKLPEKAIGLWERRLGLALGELPANVFHALDGLYTKTARWKDLASLLDRRLQTVADEGDRLDSHRRLAELYDEKLDGPAEAIQHWREAMDPDGPDPRAVSALTNLYQRQGLWEELEHLYTGRDEGRKLLRVLEDSADDAVEPSTRVQLVRRIAALSTEFGDESRAITAQEKLLELEPDNPSVARDLIPVYRGQERWPELIRMYEVLLEQEEEPRRRLDLMSAVWNVYEKEQGDSAAAFRWCGKAFQESADEGVAEELVRLAERTDNWEELVLIGKDVVQRIDEPDRQVRHYLRLGEVCMNRLAWVDDAITYFRQALTADSESRTAIDALERLFARAERWDDLVEILRRKADLAAQPQADGDPDDRIRILFQIGELLEDILDRPAEAASTYTRILDIDGSDQSALSGLERLHDRGGDWAAAAGVVEQQLRLATDEGTRIDRLFRLGNLHEAHLEAPARALELYRDVLDLRPGDERTVMRLEAMVEGRHEHVRAARMLEPIYRGAERWDKLADALEVALVDTDDVGAQVADLRHVAQLCRERIDQPRRAFDALLRAHELTPEDRGLWDDLETLAAELEAWEDLVGAFHRAVDASALLGEDQVALALRLGAIREERLGQTDEAAAAYERVLELDPDRAHAYDALESLYTRMARWNALVRTLERKAVIAESDQERLIVQLKVCDLFEEVLEDHEKAAESYQQVLGLDPGNLTALIALERLYTGGSRWADLADILRAQIAARGEGADARSARFRLGRVLAGQLGEHVQAVETWREVLQPGPHEEATAALEALMQTPPESLTDRMSFVRRVTEVLEPVLERDELWARLVPVIETRFELAEDPDEQVELLRRVATLKEVRLEDPAGASDALGRALLIRPGEPDVRRELERLAAVIGAWPGYLDVLKEAVERAPDTDVRLALLRRAAEVADEELGAGAESEMLYRQLLEEQPGDRSALDALERLLRKLGKHEAVVAVLEQKVEGAAELSEIQTLLHSMAEIQDGVLDRHDDAIATYHRLLDHAPDDTKAIGALEQLLATAGRWEELIRVYRMRADLQSDPADRMATLGRIATVFDEHLEQWQDAVAVWMQVLDIEPGDRTAAAELGGIYKREQRWTDLLDVLARQVDLREDVDEQADLKLQIAELLERELDEADRAVDAYQSVLDLRPSDPGARSGLERLMKVPGIRRRAAKTLEPLYERSDEWGPLADALEVQVGESDLPAERVELLLRVAELSVDRLQTPKRAFAALSEAFPQHHADERVVSGLERLAGGLDIWDDLAALLREGADDEADGAVLLDLRLRIARIEHEEMRRLHAARDEYRRVLDLDPNNDRALDALESIYRATAEWDDLIAVLRTKADVSTDDDDRTRILFQMAAVRRDVLADPDGAVAVYREVLDIADQHPEALAGLTALFEEGSRWDDLEELLLRQIAAAPEHQPNAPLKHRLGEVRANHLDRPAAALEVWAEVLDYGPAHPPTVKALEKLLEAGTERSHTAALLEPIYRQGNDWKQLVGTLRARRDTSDDPEYRVEAAKEIASLLEEQLFEDKEAFTVLRQAFSEAPEDRGLRADLERLAEQVSAFDGLRATLEKALGEIGDPDIRVEVLRVLARTCDERLQDYEGAREFWQQVIAAENDGSADSDNPEAALALERLHTRLEDWSALVDLYHLKADRTLDAHEKVTIYFKICNLWEEVLDDPDQAVDTFRRVLDFEPDNRAAISGLERLYHSLARWEDLADLLSMEIGMADNDAKGASLRHRLGELYEREMDKRGDAVALLSEAMVLVPGHPASVKSLEKMFNSYGDGKASDTAMRARICGILEVHYERTEDWARLVGVYEAQHQDSDDVPTQVQLLRKIATIHEQKQRDMQGAFATLARAFSRVYGDPDIRRHLERIAQTLDWWDRVVNTYLEGIEEVDDPELAKVMLARLGEIFEGKLDHAENAIEVYRRLLLIQDDHPAGLDALERLYARTGRHEDLVEVLHRKAMLAHDVLDRKELLYRICEIWEDVVGDRDKAIETYRAVREIDPDDLSAVEALERLYTVTGDWVALVELFREMAEMAVDNEERVRCWFEVARISEEHLDDADGAVDAYRAVLDVQGANSQALRALENLYEAEGRWPELLDALELALAASEAEQERARIQMRMGNLLQDHLDDVPRALETYRGVLETSHHHAGAIVSLEGMLGDEAWRYQAAQILEPVYDQGQTWDKLVRVLKIRAEATDDPDNKVEVLRRAAAILEERLEDVDGAFAVLSDATRLRPAAAELSEQLERLARKLGDMDALASVLSEVRAATGDFEIERNLSLQLAPILDKDLGRPTAAIECYEQVLESDPYHAPTLAALDRLYGATERWEDLSTVLEGRLGMADPADAIGLRLRLGGLREERFHDLSGALDCYRQVLWDEPRNGDARVAMERISDSLEHREAAVEVLDNLYRDAGEWRPLLSLMDKKLDLVEDAMDRALLLQQSAEIAETELDDRPEAFDRYARALSTHSGSRQSLEHLERLAGVEGKWQELARVMDHAAERGGDLDTRRSLRMKAARVYREQLSDEASAEERLQAVLELIEDDPEALAELESLYGRTGDVRKRVGVAWRRAETLIDGDERKKIYRQVAQLAAEALSDTAQAAKALRRILELDEDDVQALDALEGLYLGQGSEEALTEVLEMRAQRTTDGEERLALHKRLGQLYRGLERPEDAARNYRSVLDIAPEDAQVLYTLQTIHEQAGQHEQLQEVLLRRAELERDDQARVRLLKKLSKLTSEQFEDASGAADFLRQVLDLDPDDEDALTGLADLYGQLERWPDMVDILQHHAEGTEDPQAKLSLLVRISGVAQDHLSDPVLTADTLQQVLEVDPDNTEALGVLVRTYELQEDWDRCLETLDRQLALLEEAEGEQRATTEPSVSTLRRAEGLHRKGELLADRLGRAEEGIACFLKAFDLDQRRADTADRLKRLYRDTEQWPPLAQVLRRQAETVDDSQERAGYFKQLAEVAGSKLDAPEVAVDALEQARQLTPDDPEVTRPLVEAYVAAEHWSEARPLLDSLIEALKSRRKLKELHVYLHLRGVVAEETADPDGARSDFEAAHELDATYLPNLISLGQWYFTNTQWDNALKIFQTLLLHQSEIQGTEQKADVFWHLGRIRQELGDARRAKDMFSRALMLVPGHERSKKGLETLGG